jgi:FKBP-type peptidyl-prolyl cis-trans isomerase FkpA
MRPFRSRALLLAFALTLPIAACTDNEPVNLPAAATVETTTFAASLGIDLSAAGWTKSADGLYYRTLSVPTAPSSVVSNGTRVSVNYTLWLPNGTQLQAASFAFNVGRGEVIPGFDRGVVGMRVGERRRLLIPPALAYGAAGNGAVPGNSVIVFDVEVLSVV